MGNSGLVNFLIRDDILSKTDCQIIARETGHHSGSFAKGIIALGIFDEYELANYTSLHTKIPVIKFADIKNAKPDLVNKIGKQLIEQLEIIPLELDKNSMKVAMCDPLDRDTIEQLSFFTGLQIKPAIATFSDLKKGLSALLGKFDPHETELGTLLSKYTAKKQMQPKPKIIPTPIKPKTVHAPVKAKVVNPEKNNNLSNLNPTVHVDIDDTFHDLEEVPSKNSKIDLDDLSFSDTDIDLDQLDSSIKNELNEMMIDEKEDKFDDNIPFSDDIVFDDSVDIEEQSTKTKNSNLKDDVPLDDSMLFEDEDEQESEDHNKMKFPLPNEIEFDEPTEVKVAEEAHNIEFDLDKDDFNFDLEFEGDSEQKQLPIIKDNQLNDKVPDTSKNIEPFENTELNLNQTDFDLEIDGFNEPELEKEDHIDTQKNVRHALTASQIQNITSKINSALLKLNFATSKMNSIELTNNLLTELQFSSCIILRKLSTTFEDVYKYNALIEQKTLVGDILIFDTLNENWKPITKLPEAINMKTFSGTNITLGQQFLKGNQIFIFIICCEEMFIQEMSIINGISQILRQACKVLG